MAGFVPELLGRCPLRSQNFPMEIRLFDTCIKLLESVVAIDITIET